MDIPNRITKEEVNALPIFKYEGEIALISDQPAFEKAMEEIAQEAVIGFDTETRPAFKRGQSYPTSLVQLATRERVYLVQLAEINRMDSLVRILASAEHLKVGVALRDDFVKLRELYEFEEAGVIDVAKYTKRLGIVNTGLRNLAAIFLSRRISKGAQVSNWAKKDLTEAQINYAATDAWVSRMLYLKIGEHIEVDD
ncbi:MAG: 3'-5' exonuclease domain-containing protein 2 [Opitutales bacterium]|nr:3'-5' exonuclease domain-containing protein 2 [Opitutales bacterium]NRA27403.1 3'-5' exonuclease domain-containing protein 2 [Opitutales bacterium]